MQVAEPFMTEQSEQLLIFFTQGMQVLFSKTKPAWQVAQDTLVRQTEQPMITVLQGLQVTSLVPTTKKVLTLQVRQYLPSVQLAQLLGQGWHRLLASLQLPAGQVWAERRPRSVVRTTSCHNLDIMIRIFNFYWSISAL